MNIGRSSVNNYFSGMTLDGEQSKVWEKLQIISEKVQEKKQWVYFHKNKIKGLYIWGPAGRGKSMLVNQFYNSLATKRKMRIHFQRFMKDIHEKFLNLMAALIQLKSWPAISRIVTTLYDFNKK